MSERSSETNENNYMSIRRGISSGSIGEAKSSIKELEVLLDELGLFTITTAQLKDFVEIIRSSRTMSQDILKGEVTQARLKFWAKSILPLAKTSLAFIDD